MSRTRRRRTLLSLTCLLVLVFIKVSLAGSGAGESGDPCLMDEECSESLICNRVYNPRRPFCDCDPANYTWSDFFQVCVGKVGAPCSNSGTSAICNSNSFCNKSTQLCECKESYSQTTSRDCKLTYGQPCVEGECNSDQLTSCSLVSRTCSCKFRDQMKWVEEVQECRMLVNKPCDFVLPPETPKHTCVPGSICSQKSWSQKSLTGRCECFPGFTSSGDAGGCLPSFGTICSKDTPEEDCDQTNFLRCVPQGRPTETNTLTVPSETSHLHRCECEAGMTWNGFECVVLPGKSCTVNPKCSTHSTCSISSGLCECDQNFMKGESGCFLKYGSPCDGSWPCNPGTFLECKPQFRNSLNESTETKTSSPPVSICQCGSGYTWNSESNKCVGLEGSPCSLDQPCVDSASCSKFGLCECPSNSSPTPSGSCILNHGSLCSTSSPAEDRCDPQNFLECLAGICLCGFELSGGQVWIPEEGKCRSNFDRTCGFLKGRGDIEFYSECVSGFVCESSIDIDTLLDNVNRSVCRLVDREKNIDIIPVVEVAAPDPQSIFNSSNNSTSPDPPRPIMDWVRPMNPYIKLLAVVTALIVILAPIVTYFSFFRKMSMPEYSL